MGQRPVIPASASSQSRSMNIDQQRREQHEPGLCQGVCRRRLAGRLLRPVHAKVFERQVGLFAPPDIESTAEPRQQNTVPLLGERMQQWSCLDLRSHGKKRCHGVLLAWQR